MFVFFLLSLQIVSHCFILVKDLLRFEIAKDRVFKQATAFCVCKTF